MFPRDRYRPLRSDERALLVALVESDGPGSELGSVALRTQVERAAYGAAWFPGSTSFEIAVPGDVPLFAGPAPEAGEAGGAGGIVRAQRVYRGGSAHVDANVIGEVFLWVADGRLSALEHRSLDGRAPTALPGVEQLGD